jgi:PAS domain S-box-containing protein
VRGLFPKDAVLQEMLAEGYVGTTLWSAQGEPIGLIALIWRQPLADTRVATSVLQQVALRAAGELERRQGEAALRQSEERYRLLYDQNPDAVFVVDTAGRFVVANPACEVISGYSIAELLQKSYIDICAPDQLARTVESFEHGVRECKSLQLVTALLRKDGRRVEVWVAGGPITADGKTVTVHCTARDITERKRMEEEIRQGAEELRATNEELTRFNEVMVGRELRMIELKQEINSLCAQFGQPPRYGPQADAQARPKA